MIDRPALMLIALLIIILAVGGVSVLSFRLLLLDAGP